MEIMANCTQELYNRMDEWQERADETEEWGVTKDER
jgi:hypothetical protein